MKKLTEWWRRKVAPAWVKFRPVIPSVLLLVLFLVWPIVTSPNNARPDTQPLGRLYGDLDAQRVARVEIHNDDNSATIFEHSGGKYLVAYPTGYGADLAKSLQTAKVPVNVLGKGWFERYQWFVLMIFLILVAIIYLVRGGAVRQLGLKGSSASAITPAQMPTERFSDVGGADEIIAEFSQTVDALKNPGKYRAFGVKPLTGFLLFGPPGTGKTLLARAIAGEAGVPFFSVKGSDLLGRWLNDGPRAIRTLFAEARKHKVAIIFFDEIDSIASKRSSNTDSGSRELKNMLNELLAQLDGFGTHDEVSILVVGATNRPEDLDTSITRPGRLTRHAEMSPPDRHARQTIIELHAAPFKKYITDDVSYERVAHLTAGMTGAQLADLVNQAGLLALNEKSDQPVLTMKHFMDALETAEVGLARKSRVVAERDRKITAIHEGGHTLVALLDPDVPNPHRASIIPRGATGGHTRLDAGDFQYLTVAQLKGRLVYMMGGRAAEKLLLQGDFTTGAEQDLKQATELAEYMVCRVGMGAIYTAQIERKSAGHDPRMIEVTGEIDRLVKDAEDAALAILGVNQQRLERLRDALLESESLDADSLANMFGPVVKA